jgi:hypothetical protein
MESAPLPGHHKQIMSVPKSTLLSILLLSAAALAEPCPKVATTTQTPATMRAIVKSINCLVEAEAAPTPTPGTPRTAETRSGAQVDTLPIIGPQHTRTYPGLVLAILSMPVDDTRKSTIVTPDAPQATIRGAGGGECKLHLNAHRTVDAQCNQAGGTVYVVYR